MKDKLSIGIVGFGRIVELIHLQLIRENPALEVGGVYDITPQRAQLAAKRGLTVYGNLEELLDSPVDAVLIATPHNSHFPIASQALRAGKHVIVEKPVGLNADEAVKLKQIAEQENRVITVFHNRRFDSDFLLVKQLIQEGCLGQVMFVDRRHHTFGSGAFFGVKSFYPAWREEKGYGGGTLLDWGVHMADQLLQLGLGPCRHVRAVTNAFWNPHSEVEEYLQAQITLGEHVQFSMEINFASGAQLPLWVVGGREATLQVTSDREAVLYQGGKRTKEFTMSPSRMGSLLIYDSFVDAIRHAGSPAVTIEETIETMQLLDRIRASAATQGGSHGDLVLGTAARV
ncbi:MAG: oxidoreductase [Paenibacillaceae bacterium]|nr:oxidoreductase [Paenibacillaceae bacterium]